MTHRIGFCCKYVEYTNKGFESVPDLNTSTTTVAWLKRQSRKDAEQKLYDLATYNIQSVYNLVSKVSTLDDRLRMVRISSDILPVYTESSWSYFYRDPSLRKDLETRFARIGQLARDNNVRLSFHPGQFTVLASDRADVVDRSIDEFEYHVDMARWMGYGTSFHDHGFKINVHVSGKKGIAGIREALPRLSVEARNLITIENDEVGYGLDEILPLEKDLAIVLDIHHHWVRTGEYIQMQDDRVRKVIDSWRGVRPVMHYSVSREDILTDHDSKFLPDRNLLESQGHKKQKLRAHSDFYWNEAANDWALSFWSEFDICCESKAKNLASFALYQRAIKNSS